MFFFSFKGIVVSTIVLGNKNIEFRGVWYATRTSSKEKSRYIKSMVFLVRDSCGHFG